MDAQTSLTNVDGDDRLELDRTLERIKIIEGIEDCRKKELALALETVELLNQVKTSEEASLNSEKSIPKIKKKKKADSDDADDNLSTRSSYSLRSMNSVKGALKINRKGKNNDSDDADDNISIFSSFSLRSKNSTKGASKVNKKEKKNDSDDADDNLSTRSSYSIRSTNSMKGALKMMKKGIKLPTPSSEKGTSTASEERDDEPAANANSSREAIPDPDEARKESVAAQRTLPPEIPEAVSDQSALKIGNILHDLGLAPAKEHGGTIAVSAHKAKANVSDETREGALAAGGDRDAGSARAGEAKEDEGNAAADGEKEQEDGNGKRNLDAPKGAVATANATAASAGTRVETAKVEAGDFAKHWRAATDPASGKSYYFHKKTRVVTWTKPDGYQEKVEATTDEKAGGGRVEPPADGSPRPSAVQVLDEALKSEKSAPEGKGNSKQLPFQAGTDPCDGAAVKVEQESGRSVLDERFKGSGDKQRRPKWTRTSRASAADTATRRSDRDVRGKRRKGSFGRGFLLSSLSSPSSLVGPPRMSSEDIHAKDLSTKPSKRKTRVRFKDLSTEELLKFTEETSSLVERTDSVSSCDSLLSDASAVNSLASTDGLQPVNCQLEPTFEVISKVLASELYSAIQSKMEGFARSAESSVASDADCTLFALEDFDHLWSLLQGKTSIASEDSLDSRAKLQRLLEANHAYSRLSLCGRPDNDEAMAREG